MSNLIDDVDVTISWGQFVAIVAAILLGQRSPEESDEIWRGRMKTAIADARRLWDEV